MITTKSAIIFLIFSAFLLQHVSAADKTALLIANSDYGEHPLPEAKANVGKLAKVLEQAGFGHLRHVTHGGPEGWCVCG